MASSRPNLSVYARDGAIINGVDGRWEPGPSPNEEWEAIRHTFWQPESGTRNGEFLLGDFAKLSRFLAVTQVNKLELPASDSSNRSAGNQVSSVIPEDSVA